VNELLFDIKSTIITSPSRKAKVMTKNLLDGWLGAKL
jgi:hypothetical protein